MAGKPWLKWYWSDWRSDPCLRMCSLTARGLWAEMLALMQEAVPYGHLLVNGVAPTDAQLAVLAGAPSDLIPDLIRELESAGVFSRTRKSVIYSRRMIRDEKKAQTARENGKNGGNPNLGKETQKPPLDNQDVKTPDKPQSPEAISQREKETDANASVKKDAHGTRLSSEWQLPDEWRSWALESTTLKPPEITAQAERFKDFWLGKAGAAARHADWFATWRNWCRRSKEMGDGRNRTSGQRGHSMLGGFLASLETAGADGEDRPGG